MTGDRPFSFPHPPAKCKVFKIYDFQDIRGEWMYRDLSVLEVRFGLFWLI